MPIHPIIPHQKMGGGAMGWGGEGSVGASWGGEFLGFLLFEELLGFYPIMVVGFYFSRPDMLSIKSSVVTSGKSSGTYRAEWIGCQSNLISEASKSTNID